MQLGVGLKVGEFNKRWRLLWLEVGPRKLW